MAVFYGHDVDEIFNPEIIEVVSREIYAIGNFNSTHYNNVRSVPTHTEDGIPIRKLYVSNLPPKTTRSELFGIFAPYGFIKSCWLRMEDRGPNRTSIPTYAFVTFSNPADAHKALLAPFHEKQLRGNTLRISPADSWHQPIEDTDGRVRWKPRSEQCDSRGFIQVIEPQQNNEDSDQVANADASVAPDLEIGLENSEEDGASDSYNILDILNRDCLTHILSYVPIRDMILSERVSKKWRSMINEHLLSIRTFKTSWWPYAGSRLTTAVLRRVLQRLGASLQRLHIDNHWSALNDRTAHTIGKFCPNLEELKVLGMHTKNWNPLIYGCTELKSILFISCNKLTDASLVHVVKTGSSLEKLTVANNTHVTGRFLVAPHPLKLTSLSFYNCYSIQGTVLQSAMDTLPHLTTLRLDLCPVAMFKIIPVILKKLPKLEELSFSEYLSVESCINPMGNEALCESIANLKELKRLNLSRNIYISNAVLKQVAQTCHKLEHLNVSCCNSRKIFSQPGVGDDGIAAICASCTLITEIDVSYLEALSDTGMSALAKLKWLQVLTSRGNSDVTSAPFTSILNSCHYLKEIDLCGCENVTEELFQPAVQALEAHPRALKLWLASTTACTLAINPDIACRHDHPTHKLLMVDFFHDRSNPHMRPDFVDSNFDDSSDESYEDVYDHEVFNDIFGQMLSSDDELFLDDDMIQYEDIFNNEEEDMFNNGLVLF